MRRGLTIILIFCGVASAATVRSYGQCEFDVTIIEPPGSDIAIGMEVNDFGELVGYWSAGISKVDHPFFWAEELGVIMIELPPGFASARAYDIANVEQITGTMGGVITARRAFFYDGGKVTNLGTLPGGNFSEGLAINNAGQVVGYWGNMVKGNPAWSAFLWEDGQMLDLGPSLGRPISQATDINAFGQVTGIMAFALFEDARAYIWENHKVTELPPVQGGYLGWGTAINERGDVVGLSVLPGNIRHAFLWADGQTLDLGTLPGWSRSLARDVNNARQVVGYCDKYPEHGGYTAFIWQNGTMTDLNDLIPPNSGLFDITYATAINNQGQITGSGHAFNGDIVAVLLTPVDVPLGDLDNDCTVGIDDFLMLLAAWGPCPDPCPPSCPADLDADCEVGIIDFLMLIANWGPSP